MKKKMRFHDWLNVVLATALITTVAVKQVASIQAYASGNWKGYAIYRDGVIGTIFGNSVNDHAGIMGEENINISLPVIHAPGPVYTVSWGDFYSDFKLNHTFLGIYKPAGYSMYTARQNSIAAKAQQLLGISYTIFDQIDYDAGTDYYVEPEDITDLRCDGVVEYTYESLGFRVGGADGKWNIAINNSNNYNEHIGIKITPRKQNQDLLTQVTTNAPV